MHSIKFPYNLIPIQTLLRATKDSKLSKKHDRPRPEGTCDIEEDNWINILFEN